MVLTIFQIDGDKFPGMILGGCLLVTWLTRATFSFLCRHHRHHLQPYLRRHRQQSTSSSIIIIVNITVVIVVALINKDRAHSLEMVSPLIPCWLLPLSPIARSNSNSPHRQHCPPLRHCWPPLFRSPKKICPFTTSTFFPIVKTTSDWIPQQRLKNNFYTFQTENKNQKDPPSVYCSESSLPVFPPQCHRLIGILNNCPKVVPTV